MPPRKPRSKPGWSMYASLHDGVKQLLEEDGLCFTFYEIDQDNNSIRNYDTNIMGSFTCYNSACSAQMWTSKKIAITIRMFANQQYNARVYHQRCKCCNQLSRPELDSSYAERIAYRLKKWSGLQQAPPGFSGESKGPHQRHLCEGCKNGHCRQMDSWM